MRKTIIILTILAGGLFFGGCNSWLDVKPYDSGWQKISFIPRRTGYSER